MMPISLKKRLLTAMATHKVISVAFMLFVAIPSPMPVIKVFIASAIESANMVAVLVRS